MSSGGHIIYDLESTGLITNESQPIQLAYVRTDSKLNIIEESQVNVGVLPRPDIIPDPMAFYIHGIDIDELRTNGVSEFDLAKMLSDDFFKFPNTCISGYNNMSYDDVMVRNLMFRNMLSPYDHEWKNGNSRFDFFKLVQMMYALRPETLDWHTREDGKVSMRLEDVAKANGIAHESAHDALSDVLATVGIGKLIMERNPRAFDYLMGLRDKRQVMNLLSPREPLLHVSGIYGQGNRNTSMILPVIMDTSNKNKMLCVDLRIDPTDMLNMSGEEMAAILFKKREERVNTDPVVSAVGISTNALPVAVEAKRFLNPKLAESLKMDIDACNRHRRMIEKNPGFATELQKAFKMPTPSKTDTYKSLYTGGFFTRSDEQSRARTQSIAPETGDKRIKHVDVYSATLQNEDKPRQFDMLLRAKWNNYYNELLSGDDFSPVELSDWVSYLESKILVDDGTNDLTIEKFREELANTRVDQILDERQSTILDKLERHVDEMENMVLSLREFVNEIKPLIDKEQNDRPEISKLNKILGRHKEASKESSLSM